MAVNGGGLKWLRTLHRECVNYKNGLFNDIFHLLRTFLIKATLYFITEIADISSFLMVQ